ncbi:Uncharacterised protein [Enterobacter cancerogenus]|uniref:Uncharacterized protein n=1 Tax=Enterobacter cancerogenus TaxID=69218 RepID=A0A484Z986_9ENTR|nr:Uncharacterised protein [Enterobacter cancerogenus]
MEEHHIRRRTVIRVTLEMLRYRIIALRFRLAVAEAFSKQLPGAFHRVLLLRDMMATVIEQACQRLAGSLPVHTVLYAVRQTRDQRGAFHQPLRVNNGVVALSLHRVAKGVALGLNRRGEPRLAPAANGNRDHPVNRVMPGRDLRETLFHHPVKADAGNGARGVRQGRQRVQHVAH